MLMRRAFSHTAGGELRFGVFLSFFLCTLFLCHPLSIALFPLFSLSAPLSFSPPLFCLSLPPSLSLFIPLSFPHFLSLPLSLSPSLPPSLSLSLSLPPS